MKTIKPQTNTIFRGDNLAIMRAMPDACVDLIYIDPPFFTQRDYKNIWGDKESVLDYKDIRKNGFSDKSDFFERHLNSGAKGLDAYLEWMRFRLRELHRLLRPNGALYCHLDHHAIHYIKVMMDDIFGYKNFLNDISWRRAKVKGAKAISRQFARNHDSILVYAKEIGKHYFERQYEPFDEEYIKRYFRHDDGDGRGLYQDVTVGDYSAESLAKLRKDNRLYKTRNGKERVKYYLKEQPGKVLDDVWTDIPEVNGMSEEKTGWPTQKPVALLERIIASSSKAGDIVFDCFAGCGTSMHAAHNLKRKWMGIDISPTAVKVNATRLEGLGAKVNIVDEKELKEKYGIDARLKVA